MLARRYEDNVRVSLYVRAVYEFVNTLPRILSKNNAYCYKTC